MKQLKGRVWLSVIAALMLILLGWLIWQNARIAARVDSTSRYTVMLEGEYSLDGGDWKPIDNEKPIEEHFKKAVFRGRLLEDIEFYGIMNVFSKNVWYRLCDSDGDELCSYKPLASDTPGYHVNLVNHDEPVFYTGKDVTLEVEFPYEPATESFPTASR